MHVQSWLDKINQCIERGNYNESLLIIDQVEEKSPRDFTDPSKEAFFELKIMKSITLELKGEFDQALKLAEDVIEKSRKSKNKLAQLSGNVAKLYSLVQSRRLEKISSLIDETKEMLDSLTTKERNKIKITEARFWNCYGIIHFLQGQLNSSLEYYQKGLKQRQEIGIRGDIAMSLNNIGVLYRAKGELDQALDYYLQSLELRNKVGNGRDIAMSYNNIGNLYQAKTLHGRAIVYLTKSLQIREKLGDDHKTSETLYNLILVGLAQEELGKSHQVALYFDQLEQLEELDKNKKHYSIKLRTRLSRALLLKSSKRLVNVGKAQEILKEIVEEDIVEYSLTLYAMINLCEIFIEEYRFYNQQTVLKQAVELSDNIYKIAQNRKLIFLLVEALILRSKFAVLEGHLDSCFSILHQARVIAEEHHHHHLIARVERELTILEDNLAKWQDMVKQGKSVNEQVEEMKIEEYIKAAKEVSQFF